MLGYFITIHNMTSNKKSAVFFLLFSKNVLIDLIFVAEVKKEKMQNH